MEKEYAIKGIFNMKMGGKFIIASLLVILIPIFLIAYLSTRIIDNRMTEEANRAIDNAMKIASINYNIRAEQMRYGMLQAATEERFRKAIAGKDRVYLKKQMRSWKEKRPYVDIWVIADPQGRVISRLNSDIYGDIFDLNGLVSKAIKEREPITSTEIVPADIMVRENPSLINQVRIPLFSAEAEKDTTSGIEYIDDGLMVSVMTPVIGRNNEVLGIIFTGDLLNRDYNLLDTIGERTGSIVAIFHSGVSISTNLQNPDGSRPVGYPVESKVMSQLLTGGGYHGEITMTGENYIGAFNSIKNHREKITGFIFTGIPKEEFTAIQKKNINVITSATLLGIVLAMGTALLITYKITKPLEVLTDKIKEFSKGEKDARIPVATPEHTRDEVVTLSMSFNNMVEEVRERDRERVRHLEDLRTKNIELQAMTERLQATNEELEIALEEAQTQREELQSANEELTILNEDIEKNRTELVEANRRLKEDEEKIKRVGDRLQLIFNGIKDYIFLVDADYNVLEANRSFLEAKGLRERDILGQKCTNVLCDHLSCDIDIYCMVKDTYETKAPIYKETTDPKGRVFQKYSYPQFDSRGNIINVILYIRDVTEQARLRQQLIQSEKLSSLGELIAGVAHELNNPLTGVLGFSQLLLEAEKDERVKDRLTKINDEALRCKKIVQSLLTFARWHRPDKTYTDINDIIKSTIELKTYHLKVDSIEISLELDENIPDTMSDSFQIQQVILNLINNAHQSMKEKGRPCRLTIKSFVSDNKIRIEVTDTGIGISEENITRIFDPFFTTRKAGEGTGLGLSISYGIIKEHDGNIYVHSRYGEGATFVVELPVVSFKATPLKEETLPSAAKAGSVLILDDEEAILNLGKEVLSSLGYIVDAVGDGIAALEKIKEKSYDLIISDIKMPNMDGKKFYEEVRKIKPHLAGRIVFTTGDIMSRDTKKFLEDIKNLCLEKPFTIQEFKGAIARQLRQEKQ